VTKETQDRAADQIKLVLETLTDQVVLLGEVMDRIQARSQLQTEYQMAEAIIGKTLGHATVVRQGYREMAGLLMGMAELADKLTEREGVSVDQVVREYAKGQMSDWAEVYPELKDAVRRLNLELEALQGTAPGEVGYA
jgi:hypothetical protein